MIQSKIENICLVLKQMRKGVEEVELRIDHDRLFKELLETFFVEFVELFFPEADEAMDLEHIKFLQQELFTDVSRVKTL